MSVEVQYIGRLGNHLFQYAFARIVAEALGYELRCVPAWRNRTSLFGEPLDDVPGATLPELTAWFANAPQLVPGRHVTAPEERYLVGHDTPDGPRWDGHHIDLRRIVSDRRERRLILRGYFQRFEYLAPHQAKIRDWFALEPLSEPYAITPRDIVVNIRRGWDYALKGWVLSLSSYQKLLAEVPHDRVFVCGTGIDDQVRDALAPFSPIYHRAAPIDELRFISKFDHIVQSNSTFCWWASFLSRAQAVYTPRPDRGYFSPQMAGDALHTGEARYRLFDAQLARFTPFRPNPQATVRLEQDDRAAWHLIVDSPVAGVARIACTPSQMSFYEWLVAQRQPFGIDDLAPHGATTPDQAQPLLAPLVANGALVLEPRFVET